MSSAISLLNSEYLICPGCRCKLTELSECLFCSTCNHTFNTDTGIPQLFWPNHPTDLGQDVTDAVKAFYEETPFPNYEDIDSVDSLTSKANKGVFARMLNDQIPAGSKILEVGCGTGQLGIFLSVSNRFVVGADMCLNSLRLGKGFADKHHLSNIHFLQMNLFKPPIELDKFHLVICNGVLHHTSDPRGGFVSIAKLVKPGGYILIGLYHYWGRLITDLRRGIFRLSGDRFKFMDPNLKGRTHAKQKEQAWFADQYKHPHESKHTIIESLEWLDSAGFDFVRSVPSTHLSQRLSVTDNLFTPEPAAGKTEARFSEALMSFKGYQEGGFFTIIGKKRN